MEQERLTAYARLLQSTHPGVLLPDGWSVDDQRELMAKGVVVTLEADGSEPSVAILYRAAGSHPIQSVALLAEAGLTRLAEAGSGPAIDSLYRLAAETGRLSVVQTLRTQSWQPTRPALRALFDFFYRSLSGGESELELLTLAFFEDASPPLRERMLSQAAGVGWENWARIVTAEAGLASGANTGALQALINAYPTFGEPERRLALKRLAGLAETSDLTAREEAQGAIARLFVEHEDPLARQVALERGYLPVDPQPRALFLFLAEAWPEYEALDFDHSLLVGSYEQGSKALRRRLLEHGRRSGYLDWLRSAQAGREREVRWPGDLSDADWELAVRRLNEGGRWDELWQLAQAAPPLWSAHMIDHLGDTGWLPPDPGDHPEFNALRALARDCLDSPLSIRPKRSVTAPAPVNSLALRPDDALLVAGGADGRVYCWKRPDLRPTPLTLSSPTPVVRALAFSPDGSMLTAAAGDHRIRVFRLSDGAIVKTLEGHRALVRSLAITPDGRMLASAGFDGSIRLWRFPFGPELKNVSLGAGSDEIFSLVISADGRTLLTAGSDRAIRAWSLPEGTLLRSMEGHTGTIMALAPSQESDLLASAGRDNTVRVWNYQSGRLVSTIDHPHGAITALCLHPNDQVALGASAGRGPDGPHEIILWNLSTGRRIDRLQGHDQPITGLVVTGEGQSLYSADAAGRLLGWDLRAFLAIRLPGRPASLPAPGAKTAAAPVSNAPAILEAWIKETSLTHEEKKWLAFTLQLARFRQRHDIAVEENQKIPLGEFDIEL